MSEDNLWGTLPEPDAVETPYAILKEQCELLTQATAFKLTGDVDREITGDTVALELFIVAPSLNNYRYGVLTCRHEITAIYPARIWDLGARDGRDCNSPDEFKSSLKTVLTSPRVKKAISSILTQMR